MLYIDSAERHEVERLLATGLFAGVTTNPTILDRAGLDVTDAPQVHAWASRAGAQTVFLQAVGDSPDAIEAHGRTLADLGEDVVVKVPATPEGLTAGRRLTTAGVPLLLTAVYHPSQALLALAVGASWVAPYVGRMSDLGRDGVDETVTLHEALRHAHAPCRVVAASLRDVDQLARLAAAGIEDYTMSVAVCDALLSDESSAQAAAAFETVAYRQPR